MAEAAEVVVEVEVAVGVAALAEIQKEIIARTPTPSRKAPNFGIGSPMLTIRQETSEDIAAVRYVNEQAFGGMAEADLIEKLRIRQAFILSLVATDADQVVGHVLFTPVTIQPESSSLTAAGLGPLAVLPSHQKMGIGANLVRTGLEKCRQVGYQAVVVLGHPEYYPRFGFVPARTFNLKYEYPVPDEAFMALELHKGALSHVSGTVKYQSEFQNV